MFDRTAPYEQVFGIPGVTYSQRGSLYNATGHAVTYRREAVNDNEDRVVVELIAEPIERPVSVVSQSDEYRAMHWKHLAALLDQYGEPYTTKEAAVAFLMGNRSVIASLSEEAPAVEAPDTLAPFRGTGLSDFNLGES